LGTKEFNKLKGYLKSSIKTAKSEAKISEYTRLTKLANYKIGVQNKWKKSFRLMVEEDLPLPTYFLKGDVDNMLNNGINPKTFFNKNILTKATKEYLGRKRVNDFKKQLNCTILGEKFSKIDINLGVSQTYEKSFKKSWGMRNLFKSTAKRAELVTKGFNKVRSRHVDKLTKDTGLLIKSKSQFTNNPNKDTLKAFRDKCKTVIEDCKSSKGLKPLATYAKKMIKAIDKAEILQKKEEVKFEPPTTTGP